MVEVLSGKKQLVPSRGFWELLAVEEPQDNVNEEERQEDTNIAILSVDDWRFICLHSHRAIILDRIDAGESLPDIIKDIYRKGGSSDVIHLTSV
jgi:hypothetical protein